MIVSRAIDLSPFLNNGTKLPNFQMSGKTLSRNERLKSIQSGLAIALATFLIILLLIKSGPEALFGSKFTITSFISSSVSFICSKTSSVCSVKGGNTAFVSYKEETEAK